MAGAELRASGEGGHRLIQRQLSKGGGALDLERLGGSRRLGREGIPKLPKEWRAWEKGVSCVWAGPGGVSQIYTWPVLL